MATLRVGPKKTKIGWIGTGVMGSSMCMHLLKKGYYCVVYNRTKRKAKPLIEAGAQWAKSPREVAEGSDVIFTIVGFPKDVREVYFGKNGIFEGLKEGSMTVDMTTTGAFFVRGNIQRGKEGGCFIGRRSGIRRRYRRTERDSVHHGRRG